MIFMVRINKISVILKEEKKKRKKGLGTLGFGRNERVKEYNSVRFVENTLALHSRKRKLQKPGEWTVDSWLAKARKKNASNLQIHQTIKIEDQNKQARTYPNALSSSAPESHAQLETTAR